MSDWMNDLDGEDEELRNAAPVSEDRENRLKPRGKYAAVMAKLPVLIAKNAEYQDKVEQAKEVVKLAFEADGTPITAMSLGNFYAEVDTEKEELQVRVKELNLQLEAIGAMMVTAFETEGGYQVNTNAGKNISMQAEPYAQVTDRDVYREWCIKEGLERSLQLPWSTTNAMAKRLLLDAKEPPPGVQCFMKIKPVVRKAND